MFPLDRDILSSVVNSELTALGLFSRNTFFLLNKLKKAEGVHMAGLRAFIVLGLV